MRNDRRVAGVERLKSELWGMTLTPPWAGHEAAHDREPRLLGEQRVVAPWADERTPRGCRQERRWAVRIGEQFAARMMTARKTIETIMGTPIDYTALAATLDCAALDEKLSQLS
jgi:hypothetical protein